MKIVVTLLSFALFGFKAIGQLNADFMASPLTVCVGTPVNFTDQSSSSVISWAWNFGDGNTSNLENPSHTYTAAGNYNITLTVFDGATSVAEVKPGYITVNPLPVVGFTTPTSGCTVPYAPVFTGVSPGGGSYSYSWTFGNGQTSSVQTPTSANYVTAGTYNVNLTVTNNATGCVNSSDQDISVFNFDTEFSVSSTTVCVGQLVHFFDESVGANDWDWDFGNGASSGSANPVLAYSTAGTYTVTLESSNTSNGCSGTFTQIITVNPLPQPSFTGDPLFGCNPLVVDFTNTSVGAGTFQWNFGNGSTFTGANPPNQTYNTVGVFDVTLTMTDANGCSKTFTQNDYVETEPLVSDFVANVYDGCEDLLVQFTDISTSPNPSDNPITGWNWNFGNGNTFSGQFPPVQTYSEGIYDVTLTVSTAGGCTKTYTLFDSITVGIPPNASFTYTPNSGCAKSDFEFTNTTPVPPGYLPSDIDFEWDFGDGGTSIEEDPTYDYPVDTGLFDVTLIVYFRGCPDTVVVEDAVYIDAPISLFSPQQIVYCNPTVPLIVPFTDNAILGETSDNVQMIWTWGDGGTNTLTSPFLFTNPTDGSMSHTYTGYGSYTVQQVVHNFTTGCSDSTTQTIHLSQINASFSLTNDSVCRNLPLTMNSTSTSTHPLILYYYFLDGDTLTGPSQTWSDNNSGTYPMTHLIVNAVGCTDMENVNLVVLQEPVAQIAPSDVSGCAPLTVVFTNNSVVVGNGADLDEFDWTFEDGSTETTTNIGQTTDYTFTATGNFATSLIVTDEFGCVSLPASVTTDITTPTAAFAMDSAICNHETFFATDSSTNFISSEWFFDGAFVSSLPDYSNTLNEANPSNLVGISHQVKLVVTDVNGCTDTLEKTITVSMPQVFANYAFTGSNTNANGDFTCPPVFADLTDSTQSYGAISQWNWSFGDDNFSTLQNPSNTYVFAGTYTAALVVTDEFGCMDSIIFPDYLTIGGPTGDVQWLLIGDACNPEYEFSAYNVSNVSNIHWTFGDSGEIDDVGPVTYVYNSPGTYTPTALLEDEFNCVIYFEMDSLTTAANVIFAEFDIVPDTVQVYEPMIIVDQSSGGSGGITTWTWTMDDQVFTYGNGDEVTYTWMFPGLHTVELIATDTLGCTDTASHTVWVTADLFIPNVFTPNGDGINDFFVFDEPVFMQYDVIITNRWGVLMSKMTNQHGVYMWDGTDLGGDDCTAGTYFYTIEGITYYGQGISAYGEVTLVRNPH